jgi:hypothetical protein
VGREKAIKLFNFYTGLGLRRMAASMPVRDSLIMLVKYEECRGISIFCLCDWYYIPRAFQEGKQL